MIRAALLLIALALAACGGSGGDPSGGAGGAGGGGGTHLPSNVWHEDGQICVRYRPHPETDPDLERVDCVSEDWPGNRFCWRTRDEPPCFRDDGSSVAVGCVYLEESPFGAAIGEQSSGCLLPLECIEFGIDNPDCCPPQPGRRAAWNCDGSIE